MPLQKRSNPFYIALMVVGVIFAVTASAYLMMTVRMMDPRKPLEEGLVGLMSNYGIAIMMVELGILTILTFLAIGTDEYWTGSAEATSSEAVGSEAQRDETTPPQDS